MLCRYELFNIERPPDYIETRDLDENVNFRTLNTIIFNTFVYAQIFNEVNSRHLEKVNVVQGLFTNWLFVGIVLVEAGLQGGGIKILVNSDALLHENSSRRRPFFLFPFYNDFLIVAHMPDRHDRSGRPLCAH